MANKITLIEDDPAVADIVMMILEPLGFQIESHSTGRQIMNQEILPPDMFIIDGNLPDINGVEICKFLKHNHSTRDIPIIFMSANTKLIDVVKANQLAEVLEKPFDKRKLIEQVRCNLLIN